MDKNKVTNEKRLLTKQFTLKESFCLLQALKKIGSVSKSLFKNEKGIIL